MADSPDRASSNCSPNPKAGHHHHHKKHSKRKEKGFTCYKLVVDPAITKGALKLYRFDGVVREGPNPMVTVRDPRSKATAKFLEKEKPVLLRMPTFKIDSDYIGEIPPKEVCITNLCSSVSERYLTEICQRYGDLANIKVYLHPVSHRHLGFAYASFETADMAWNCVQKLHGTILHGQAVHVAYDPGAEIVKKLIDDAMSLRPTGGCITSRDVGRWSRGNGRSPASTTPLLPRGIKSTPSTLSNAPFTSNPETEDLVNRFYDPKEEAVREASKTSGYGYPVLTSSSTECTPSSTPAATATFSRSTQPSRIRRSPPRKVMENPKAAVSSKFSPVSHRHGIQAMEMEVDGSGVQMHKMDLDTRIKLMLEEGNSSGELGKLFAIQNFSGPGLAELESDSETDGDLSPQRKKPKVPNFSYRSRISNVSISEGESDEEVGEKIKESVVPVQRFQTPSHQISPNTQSSTNSARSFALPSPPASPFLTCSAASFSPKQSKDKEKFPEYDPISDVEDEQILTAVARDNDDMSRSSLPLDPEAVQGRNRECNFAQTEPPSTIDDQSLNLNNSVETEEPGQDDKNFSKDVTNALFGLVLDDLKRVLLRDCNKKFITSDAFGVYEDWLRVESQKKKQKQDE